MIAQILQMDGIIGWLVGVIIATGAVIGLGPVMSLVAFFLILMIVLAAFLAVIG